MKQRSSPIKNELLHAVAVEARSSLRPGSRRASEWIQGKFNKTSTSLNLRWADTPRNQWLRVLRRSSDQLANLPRPIGPRILMVTTFGLDWSTTMFDSVLMLALRLRGAAPIGLVCDSTLPACEFNRYGNYRPDPAPFGRKLLRRGKLETCRMCTEGLVGPYSLLPIEMAKLSEYLLPDDVRRLEAILNEVPYDSYRDYFYRSRAVGEHAYASTARHLVRGTLEDNAETRWLFRRSVLSSMLVVDLMERLIKRLRPERVVASHGIYVTQGTMADVARKHGIPLSTSASAYRLGTYYFFQGDHFFRAMLAEPNSVWETFQLTPTMESRLDDYLREKHNGSGDFDNYQRDSIADHSSIFKMLDLDPAKPLVTLYTNVLWDAQIFFPSRLYLDMLEWLFETIHHFGQRSDVQLAIRIHPAEGKGKAPTNQPLAVEIERAFPALPANIKVVQSDCPVNSYTLAEMSQAALIYGAAWSFEIALQGTPVIITGESPNRGKGFTYDPRTKDEYLELLRRIPGLPRNSADVIRRARTYAYHFHFRLSMEFPFLTPDKGRLAIHTIDELAPGRNVDLDTICQGVMDGETRFISN